MVDKEFVLNLDALVLKGGEALSVRGSGSFNLTITELLVLSEDGVLRWEAIWAWSNCSCSRRTCSLTLVSCWVFVGWFMAMVLIDSMIWVAEEEED